MRQIINSIKHFEQTPATGVASGALLGVNLVNALAKGTARTATSHVEEGAVIKAIYCEYWVKADNPNFTVNGIILKLPSGVANPTFTDLNNLQAYDNKKNILVTHQGLAPSGDQTLALFREWIKIPKGKQRMGLGDKIAIFVSFSGSAGDLCGITIYKEYE